MLPVLLGFNRGRVTLLLTPGPVVAIDSRGRATEALRLGGGVQVRLGRRVALQPEVTWMGELAGPTDLGFVTAGVGLLFGAQPSYE